MKRIKNIIKPLLCWGRKKRDREIRVCRNGYWSWTMESGLFQGEKWQPLRDVFSLFPEETQYSLTFCPELGMGEWVSRARFWAMALYLDLEPSLYHEAMRIILHAYIQGIKRQKACSGPSPQPGTERGKEAGSGAIVTL